MSTPEQTVSFMVAEVSGNRHIGLGEKRFRVAPRKGDYLTIPDADGIAQNYEVVAVIHPSEPVGTAGDLLVRYMGTDVKFRGSFKTSFLVDSM